MTKALTLAKNIFLIGPMGVGKTTVGKHLAHYLNYTFYDSDHEIELRTGATIPLIFELEGEAGFRHREQSMIDELSQKNPIVLATGGGVILSPRNRQVLHERGQVFYLYASLDILYERTVKNKSRPLLQTDKPRERLGEIMQQRQTLYQTTAHHHIETGEQSVRTVLDKIVASLDEFDDKLV